MSIEDELRQVEADLERLKAENQDMRNQVRDQGVIDQFETATMISLADQQAEQIAELEQRREALRRKVEEG
ncbi:hypothetical protein HII36_36320 [Nonomuraea sp. NN258]|uniref:hypothetical protein n=1 Tax=Nonomuraea antri TaxID=2730852 RepID=UPI001569ABAA|nr:hypothetical protein [Nonomuraea antri]NRQ37265.1 hypothetical protein [Nonomuraea antri]